MIVRRAPTTEQKPDCVTEYYYGKDVFRPPYIEESRDVSSVQNGGRRVAFLTKFPAILDSQTERFNNNKDKYASLSIK